MVDWIGQKRHQAINKANCRVLQCVEDIKPTKVFNISGKKSALFIDSVKQLKNMTIKLEQQTSPSVCRRSADQLPPVRNSSLNI
jgi:hypothetical protein